tara:strand:+ start:88 stop:582 length:495 start_codon:yes stop_codon:yes gene_type:complete
MSEKIKFGFKDLQRKSQMRRAEEIEDKADTAAEKKYAKKIMADRKKELRAAIRKSRRDLKEAEKRLEQAKKGHSKGTRGYKLAEEEKKSSTSKIKKQRSKRLRTAFDRTAQDLSLLENYKSEAPMARGFMTDYSSKKSKKKAGGGYVKKYANGGGVRKAKFVDS